jgi:hypothetical protein
MIVQTYLVYSCCCLLQVRFVFSTGSYLPLECYKFSVTSRITPSALWIPVAVLLLWSASPVSTPDASPGLTESGLVAQEQPHGMSSVHDPCALPDCASYSDCPTDMSMSNCSMSGVTCSIFGVSILMHRMDERCFQQGTVISFQDPMRLILQHRSANIFHPPRSS